jgi:hypothetical protein
MDITGREACSSPREEILLVFKEVILLLYNLIVLIMTDNCNTAIDTHAPSLKHFIKYGHQIVISK